MKKEIRIFIIGAIIYCIIFVIICIDFSKKMDKIISNFSQNIQELTVTYPVKETTSVWFRDDNGVETRVLDIVPLERVGHEVDEYLDHEMKLTSKTTEVVFFYYWLYENGYRIVRIKEN